MGIEFYSEQTTQGSIAIADTKVGEKTLILLHPNSVGKSVFRKQLESDLAKKYRLIALDLPGHADSDRAKTDDAYTIPGLAAVVHEVIDKLNLTRPAVFGWSLGGHVGLELLKLRKLSGLVITGTPPIPLNLTGFVKAFKPHPDGGLLSQEKFTNEDAVRFMHAGSFDTPELEAEFTPLALKADGRFRSVLFQSLHANNPSDQLKIVQTDATPLAVIQGRRDAVVNTDYIVNEVAYRNLYKGQVFVHEEGDHALVWKKADQVNTYIEEFLDQLTWE